MYAGLKGLELAVHNYLLSILIHIPIREIRYSNIYTTKLLSNLGHTECGTEITYYNFCANIGVTNKETYFLL